MKKAINAICFFMLIIMVMVIPSSATTLSVCTSGTSAVHDVPDDYANVGIQEGTLKLWAESVFSGF